MAKEFVRSITSTLKKLPLIKQSLTKPNDLLCFNDNAYIHLKKSKDDEYHCLTDNIKTASSSSSNVILTKENNNLNIEVISEKPDKVYILFTGFAENVPESPIEFLIRKNDIVTIVREFLINENFYKCKVKLNDGIYTIRIDSPTDELNDIENYRYVLACLFDFAKSE